MRNKSTWILVFSAFLLTSALATADSVTPPTGPMTALPRLGGDTESDAFALNESGLVVGSSTHFAGRPISTAVYWDAAGNVHPIRSGMARSVNESGRVAGYGGGQCWTFDVATEKVTLLAPLEPDTGCSARSINDAGDVAGTALVTVGVFEDGEPDLRARAVLWRHEIVGPGAVPALLPTLGGPDAVVFAMNNLGEITGQSTKVDDGIFVPVVWLPGSRGYTIVELPNEGGSDGSDYGRAINDGSQVAGTASFLPFVWEAGKHPTATQLRSVSGSGPEGVANGINNRGEMVGFLGVNGEDPATLPRGVYWRNGGKAPVFLGTLGGDTTFPRAISDGGVIVGLAALPDGSGTGFIIRR